MIVLNIFRIYLVIFFIFFSICTFSGATHITDKWIKRILSLHKKDSKQVYNSLEITRNFTHQHDYPFHGHVNINGSAFVNFTTVSGEYVSFSNNTIDYEIGDEFHTTSFSESELKPITYEETLDEITANPDFTVNVNFNASTTYDASFKNNLLLVVLSFFCLATVFGNVLVMVAVAKEPYLHTVTNYFIASLATADCIVGAVVMPFCVILEVRDGYWPFGPDWCDIWRSIDVLASTASILNLCVISLDRYWAITDSMSYPSKMTPTKAGILVALVWICSALISFPAIAWWRAVSTGPPPEYECPFTEDIGYLVFSSAVSFYLPLTVMVFTYYKIYRAAIEQTKSLKLGAKQVHAVNGNHCTALTLRIHRGGVLSPHIRTQCGNNNSSPSCSSDKNSLQVEDTNCERTSLKVPSRHAKAFSLSKRISKLARERKAAKTLGIVMGVFILCWLPFFVTNVLLGVCGDRCVMDSELVFSIVTWLGWTNSGMNPVIYACWSRDFRRAFNKLLCSCCPSFRRRRQNQRSRFRQIVKDDAPSPRSRSPTSSVVRDVCL